MDYGIVDAHCHIYTRHILDNVMRLRDSLSYLGLQFAEAGGRLTENSLIESARLNGVAACVVLHTARVDRIREANDAAIRLHRSPAPLFALATLHPAMSHRLDEMVRIAGAGIRGLKFSSFSQQIEFEENPSLKMLSEVQAMGERWGAGGPTVVLDTFVGAMDAFGAPSRFITGPATLNRLAERFPGIRFIGAHMGGLTAGFDEIRRHLRPRANLYLDTSNAAHTLGEPDFVRLLQRHGPDQVLFGTDWPWFGHGGEIDRISRLMELAGFGVDARRSVFRDNAVRLLLPRGWAVP
jgi:predicted TIM-barrel fold metal-dependent hydrolase